MVPATSTARLPFAPPPAGRRDRAEATGALQTPRDPSSRARHPTWPGLPMAGLILCFTVGCATTPTAEGPEVASSRPPTTDPDKLDDVAFLHDYLVWQPTVTVDEACRAMLILSDGQDTSRSHEDRRRKLEERQVLRPAWGLRPDQPVDNGTVAYMTARILRLRGGINRMLLGSWGLGDRRYALRELVYRGLMSESPPYRYITGAELTELLRKADDTMRKRGIYQSEVADFGEAPPPGTPLSPAPPRPVEAR